jgi:glutamate-5-semialdehyde dehydrogenase
VTTEEKNDSLRKIAEQLLIDQHQIIAENHKDILVGKEKGLSHSILDRILLNEKRIQDMVDAIFLLIDLKDPIGDTIETIQKENGLLIKKNRH